MSNAFDPSTLTALDHQLAVSWRLAAAELGIAVTAPFELPVADKVYRYGGLVHHFGTERGVLLRAMFEEPPYKVTRELSDVGRKAGFYSASLSPLMCYYTLSQFIQFLNVFEWCGPPAERPPWHAGPDLVPQPGSPGDSDHPQDAGR
jgi:hypothetical protein